MGQNFNTSEPSLKDIVRDPLGWTQSEIQEDESSWSSLRGREVEAKVEVEPRSQKEEVNLGKAPPYDISDTHLLPCSVAILDDLPDKMGDPGVPTISCWLAPRSVIKLSNHGAILSVMPKVIYDQLNHDSFVPTSLHLHLADQLIRLPVATVEDIPVRIRNSFMHVDFVIFKNGLPRMSGIWRQTSILSTTGARIDDAARIIKLNINMKEETFTF
jgi:hypothetical protein